MPFSYSFACNKQSYLKLDSKQLCYLFQRIGPTPLFYIITYQARSFDPLQIQPHNKAISLSIMLGAVLLSLALSESISGSLVS